MSDDDNDDLPDLPADVSPIPTRAAPTALWWLLLLFLLGVGLPGYYLWQRVYRGQPRQEYASTSPTGDFRAVVTPWSSVFRQWCWVRIEYHSGGGGDSGGDSGGQWKAFTRQRYDFEESLPGDYSFLWTPQPNGQSVELIVYARPSVTRLVELGRWTLQAP